tara:strand:- start:6383 stop:10804 length:4422 start_codon:yes stop_codon:yes gene_type:complete
MIKNIKLSDKNVRKFRAKRKWKYSSLESTNELILEQEVDGGTKIPLFSDINNIISLEQSESDPAVTIRFAKKTEGTFFPRGHPHFNEDEELLNKDGTYCRTIHKSISHLFYNNYGTPEGENDIINPLMIFGSETGVYGSDVSHLDAINSRENLKQEIRKLGDSAWVLDFSKNKMGDKVSPNSFTIKDKSSDLGSVKIIDDGATNLVISDSSLSSSDSVGISSNSREISREIGDGNTFDFNNLSFGKNISAYEKYLLVGCPVSEDAPSDIKTGKAEILLHNQSGSTESGGFSVLKELYCPFTQNGISQEISSDGNDILTDQLGNLLVHDNYTINDMFGSSVDITRLDCVVGSPQSHIRGSNEIHAHGHVFVYNKDKGGIDNWGLINILEGEPGSEFGFASSLHRDYLLVGSPGHDNNNGSVYVFKKTKRTENHPWIRVSNVYDEYEYDETTGKHKGTYPTETEEVNRINRNVTRWKIENVISERDEPISYIDNSILDVVTFDDKNISTKGEYEGTPEFAIGDPTYDLVSVITLKNDELKSFKRFGEIVKITDTNIFIGSRENKMCAVFTWDASDDTEFTYTHEQTISSLGIFQYNLEPTRESSYFDTTFDVDYEEELVSITITNLLLDESDISDGFVYRLNQPLNKNIDNVVTHGGTFVESIKVFGGSTYNVLLPFSEFSSGVNKIYLGLEKFGMLHGNESVVTISIGPDLYNTQSRDAIVKTIYEYNFDIQNNFMFSLDANESYCIIGDPNDREFNQRNDPIKITAGSAYVFKIENGRLTFNEKIYGEETDELLFSTRFGSDVSILGDNFIVGSPCTETSSIEINSDLQNVSVSDYTQGSDGSDSDFYISNTILKTDFTYELLGGNPIDCKLKINITNLILELDYLKDFEIYADFIDKNASGYIREIGFLNKGIFRDKTNVIYENDMIFVEFYISLDQNNLESLIDSENSINEIDFAYYAKRNSVEGSVYYYSIINDNPVIRNSIKSYKNSYSIRKQSGTSVALSSNFMFSGCPVEGKFPVSGLYTMQEDEIYLFSDVGTVATSFGNFSINELDYLNYNIGGKVIAYESTAIRDNKRTYVGNVFYKNGIAVISNVFEQFDELFSGTGERGFELEFEGSHTIYENEILCRVEPYEFNVSTNPTSISYEKIAFDVNEDSLFDIRDVANIYKYIMGSLVDPTQKDASEDEYTVGKETLQTIARQYEVDISDIKDSSGNKVTERTFKVGMLVLIRNKIRHIVKRVESMVHISLVTGVTTDVLRKENNLRSDLSLYVGQKLKIPSGGDVPGAIKLQEGQNTNNPNDDIIMTESEDVLLISSLFSTNSNFDIKESEYQKIIGNLDNLKQLGSDGLDIDGDGIVSSTDAHLLARYFVGRRGNELTKNLIDENSNATRSTSFEIIKYLDEKTGKNYGRKIKQDFLDFRENTAKDRKGSYLAPYATTIGLYQGAELAMVAKLGRPVKIIPNYPINFLIKYDS